MNHVRALVDPALAGREAGTPGEAAAAKYVTERLREMGLTAIEQPFPHGSGSRNIYVTIEGREKSVVVVGAHLDHLGNRGGELYLGADDNASGVALTLGLAATLVDRKRELDRSVLLVFFGAEEAGLLGSRYFVDHSPVPRFEMRVMVNIDMIGRPLVDQPLYRLGMGALGIDPETSTGLIGVKQYPGVRSLADKAFTAFKGTVVAPEDLPDPIDDEVERQSARRGDYASFEDIAVVAMMFGDGESSDYHKPTDTIDKLKPALLEQRARALARFVMALSKAPDATFLSSDAPPPKRTWKRPSP
jgi:hypothetical protein